MKSFFQECGKKYQDAISMTISGLNTVLSSHKAVTNTATAASLATKDVPSLTFGYFFSTILCSLPEADPVVPIQLAKPQLDLFALCATLSDIVYDDRDVRKIPEEAGPIVYEQPASKLGRIPFFITNSSQYDTIFVVLRGSYCFNDFLVDMMANSIEVDGNLMHNGVFLASVTVMTFIADFLPRLAAENGGRRILFTGHSLGGAVASTICRMYRRLHPESNANCIAYAPAACVNHKLWDESLPYTTCIVFEGDPVPFLSYHNVSQISSDKIPPALIEYITAAPKLMSKRKMNVQTPAVPIDYNPFSAPPPPLTPIEQVEAPTDADALYPPGDPYVLRLTGSTFKKAEVAKIQSVSYFGHFPKGLNEERHAMFLYREVLNELTKGSSGN